jgi:hypothetical protein
VQVALPYLIFQEALNGTILCGTLESYTSCSIWSHNIIARIESDTVAAQELPRRCMMTLGPMAQRSNPEIYHGRTLSRIEALYQLMSNLIIAKADKFYNRES